MGKTRIVNLAKELKMEVRELIQRLKDDLGLQENFTYLSSLDERDSGPGATGNQRGDAPGRGTAGG